MRSRSEIEAQLAVVRDIKADLAASFGSLHGGITDWKVGDSHWVAAAKIDAQVRMLE